MKLSIKQDELAKGLGIVGKAVSTKATLPVLNNILLEASKEDGGETGCLKLAATNLSISLIYQVNCAVAKTGGVTIPARLLTEFVTSLATHAKDASIELELNDETQTLHIKCGRSEANIRGIHTDDFPSVGMADHNVARLCTMQAAVLKEAISQVAFAASQDETRPVLTAVYAVFEGDKLVLAAADSFRLAVKHTTLLDSVATPKTLLLPSKAMTEFARLLSDSGDADNQVDIYVSNNDSKAFFVYQNIVFATSLVEGNFPNYQQIIPKSSTTTVTVATNQLMQAVKTANIFAKDSNGNIVRLSVMASELGVEIDEQSGASMPVTTFDKLLITANSNEVGDNKSELDIVLEGDNNQIAFNAKYMVDVLNVIDVEKIVLELLDGSKPGVVKPVGKDDYVYVIMPMHLAPR